MSTTDLVRISGAAGLRRELKARRVSAVEVCSEVLDLANADRLGCFWELDPERALEAASMLDRELSRGHAVPVLAGLPVAIKDCYDVAGLHTTVGIRRKRLESPAQTDAQAVERLRTAGAVVIGKTAMDQLAWTMSGQSPGFPACRNPLDPARMPGGSSSGSAASVGAAITPLGIGTDAGGSVRVPASWCGVVGFKPTFGAVPLGGCVPMAPSMDTGGGFGRSVEDVCLLYSALTGVELPAIGSVSPRRLRVGVLETSFEADASVQNAARRALEAWAADGIELRSVEIDWPRRQLGTVYATEFASLWAQEVEKDAESMSEQAVRGIETGRAVKASDYRAALASLEEAKGRARALMDDLDFLVTPTSPLLPPPLGDPEPVVTAGRNARPFNGLGWPAASVPCGRVGDLSVGLQISGLPGRDLHLLSAALDLERALSVVP